MSNSIVIVVRAILLGVGVAERDGSFSPPDPANPRHLSPNRRQMPEPVNTKCPVTGGKISIPKITVVYDLA